MFKVSEQHGRHDALLCVDGEQGGAGLLLLQRHQNHGAAADGPSGEPAGESEDTSQLHITSNTEAELQEKRRSSSPSQIHLLPEDDR